MEKGLAFSFFGTPRKPVNQLKISTVDNTKNSNLVNMPGMFTSAFMQNKNTFAPNSTIEKKFPNVDFKKIVFLESGDQGYTAENPLSGAYGKYQFLPSVAKEYSERLNIPFKNWKDPKTQEKIFEAFTNDNIKALKESNIPIDTFHVYGAHQQGVKGFKDILANNITPQREKNMASNLPDKYKHLKGEELRNAWLTYWKNKVN